MNALNESKIGTLSENHEPFEEMVQDFISTLEKTPEIAVCPPPKAPCKAGYYMGWLVLNAIAYGFKRGAEAAEVAQYE